MSAASLPDSAQPEVAESAAHFAVAAHPAARQGPEPVSSVPPMRMPAAQRDSPKKCSQLRSTERPDDHTLHVSMKRNRSKVLQGEFYPATCTVIWALA